MLIIGLYGGRAIARDSIARSLAELSATQINVLRDDRCASLAESRLKSLEQHLVSLDRRHRAPSLIISRVETLAEAQLIRAHGGRLWFAEGSPSDVIPIAADDLPITARHGGRGRYLEPIEALQQEVLAQRLKHKAARSRN